MDLKRIFYFFLLLILIFFNSPEVYSTTYLTKDEVKYIQEKYQILKKNFLSVGIVNPDNIADLIARKFINKPDWQRAQLEKKFNPRFVYNPAPVTWDNWQKVDIIINEYAHSKMPLTLEKLLEWNSSALNNTIPPHIEIGKIKATNNYGQNIYRQDALTSDEIDYLLAIKFSKKQIKLGWTSLFCKEDFPGNYSLDKSDRECKKIFKTAKNLKSTNDFWKKTYDDMIKFDLLSANAWFWYACWPRLKDDQVQSSKCGMIIYPKIKYIESEIKAIIEEVNNFNYPNQSQLDPATFAFSMQRRLVALHPFNKGNGRASRWVMDYILKKYSLPFILIENMNKDLTIAPDGLSNMARQGMMEYLNIMDNCFKQYQMGLVQPNCSIY